MTQKSYKRILNMALLCTMVLGLLPMSSSYAGLYKWTDEHGNVHFGDQPPAANTKHGHDVFANSGVRLRTIERELTEEEQLAASQITEEMKLQMQADRELERIDRLLTLSFPTVQTLDAARDDRLSTYDDSIAYLQSRKDALAEKEGDNSARIKHFRRKKLAVPVQLTSEASMIETALSQLDAQIAEIQNDRDNTIEEFKKYKNRLQDLRSGKQ